MLRAVHSNITLRCEHMLIAMDAGGTPLSMYWQMIK